MTDVKDKQEEGKKPEVKASFGPPDPVKRYVPAMWNEILPTFRCTGCGHCDEDEDEMKLHVLVHVPKVQQNKVLDQLVKEK